ncbi:LOW QUALITY PROTEIN: protein LURP-one-related 12-like [Argentina anserina]|uniref:LOW QUALITY PROTEIN: protein LURP-one-related 12-like n=1 Tax=Argentina anserina TaxID=57926 RepID=UPI0021767E26|nr:LOW QUALITY PROTEIN: protein LURP-one-related 12-like [Potentilla anserina]
MKEGIVEPAFVFEEDTYFTVSKTSLFFAGDGFSVYDRNAQLVFRVDSYGPDPHDRTEPVLMDATGSCLLTVRRKRPSLHHRWEGFVGERMEGQKPIFSVRRSSIIGRSSVTVEVFRDEYHIEGSFAQRCCKIYNADKQPVAEIHRKVDVSTNVVLGKDVFSLVLKPGFDPAFAMGLVLVLDQINGDGFVERRMIEEEEMDLAAEEQCECDWMDCFDQLNIWSVWPGGNLLS